MLLSASFGGQYVDQQPDRWVAWWVLPWSVHPDKATDMSQTEKCFPSLDSRYALASPSEALENTLGQLPGRKY